MTNQPDTEVGAISAMLSVCVWSLIRVSYIVHRWREPEAHDQSVFKMSLGNFMLHEKYRMMIHFESPA